MLSLVEAFLGFFSRISIWGRSPDIDSSCQAEHGTLSKGFHVSVDSSRMGKLEIMRAFVGLRRMLTSNEELARKLAALERKYDAQFKVVFDAFRELMTPPTPKRRKIGFLVEEKAAACRRR